MRGLFFRFVACASGLAFVFIGAIAGACAGTIAWEGDANTTFANGNNWAGDTTVPGAGDVGQFNATTTYQPNLTASHSIQGLDFVTAGWTLSSGSTSYVLTVGTVGIDSAGEGSNTVSAPVALGASSTWTIAPNNTLLVSGLISASSSSHILTKDGLGTLELTSGSNSFQRLTLADNGGLVRVNGSGRLSDNCKVILGSGAEMEFGSGVGDRFDTLDGSGTLRLAATSTYVVINSGTFSGVIEGDGYLQKYNTGTLTLTGANTYTGRTETSTNSGTALVFAGPNGSAVNSAYFNLGGNTDSSSRMELRLDNAAANNNDRIGDDKGVNVRGGELKLIGNAAVATTEDIGLLTLAYRNGTVTLDASSGGATTLQADSLVRGNVQATLLVRGKNLGNVPAANGANLTFDTAPTLSHAGGVGTPAVGILPYVIVDTSPIGTGTDLATYDTHGVRPLAASEYAGAIVADQNVKLTSTPGAGTDGLTIRSLTLANSGTPIELSVGSNQTLTIQSGVILSTGSVTNTISGGKLTFANNAATSYEGTLFAVGNLTISSEISDHGDRPVSLTKAGPGTLTLERANTYTGSTVVNLGTLSVTASDALSHGALTNNATLRLNGTSQKVGNLTGVGSLDLGTGGSLTTNLTASNSYYGVISGAGGTLTKGGSGGLTLRGANTFTGATTINSGELQLAYSGRAVNSSGFTVNPGATLYLKNDASSSSSYNQNDRIGNTAAVTLLGSTFRATGNAGTATTEVYGPLLLAGGHSTLTLDAMASGALTLTGASLSRNPGATALVRGDSLGANPAANVANAKFTAAPTLSHPGGFATPAVGILPYLLGDTTVSGSGSSLVTYDANGLRPLDLTTEFSDAFADNVNVRLTANASTDTRTIRALAIHSPSSAAGTTVTINTGQVLAVESNAILSTGSATNYLNGGTLLFAANDATQYEGVFHVVRTLAVGSSIVDNGTNAVSIVKDGGGTLYLRSTSNTYTGRTIVNAGPLRIAAENRLGVNPATFTADQLTLNGGSLQTDSASFTIDDSNRGITLGPAGGTFYVDSTRTITIGSANVIAGGGNLTKDGTGLLTLQAANTYTGNTTIKAGTLALGATGAIPDSPVISIAGSAVLDVTAFSSGFSLGLGQTLTGDGTVQGSVVADGTLAPGNAIGTFTVTDDYTMNDSAWLFAEINGDTLATDQIAVRDEFTANGSLLVSLASGTVLNPGDSFRIINAAAILGSFDAVTLPTLDTPGLFWDLSSLYATGQYAAGTIAVGMVVPEPSTLALLASLGAAGLIGSLRRRQHRTDDHHGPDGAVEVENAFDRDGRLGDRIKPEYTT